MIPEQKESVLIVAGGKGVRAGGEVPKQFRLIAGRPVLMHAIEAFYRYNPEICIVVVLPEGFEAHWKKLCQKHSCTLPHRWVTGGETRFHSVQNGLQVIPAEGIVAIHDAARPLVTPTLIGRCFESCILHQCGVIPVIRESNSVRQLTEEGSRILSRELLRVVQTPQVFPSRALKQAYETSYDSAFTDDASVAEKNGLAIRLEKGEESNLKITTTFDFLIAEQYLLQLAKR